MGGGGGYVKGFVNNDIRRGNGIIKCSEPDLNLHYRHEHHGSIQYARTYALTAKLGVSNYRTVTVKFSHKY